MKVKRGHLYESWQTRPGSDVISGNGRCQVGRQTEKIGWADNARSLLALLPNASEYYSIAIKYYCMKF